MADRPSRPVTRLTILRAQQITPHMRRIYAGGPGFALFRTNDFTDKYVKILFPPLGMTYPGPFDLEVIRATLPRSQWPVTRTYTVRSVDPHAGEIAIDLVLHGDEGLAGPWAARVQPGEEIFFHGPGGAYAPDSVADWHLLAGDEAALPAIASALEHIPEGAPVRAYIEVADASERQDIATKGDADINWLYRHDAPAGDVRRLVEAVKDGQWLPGTPHVFVHGESGLVNGLRSWFLTERGVPPQMLSISGYWRAGLAEQGFRQWKADQRKTAGEATPS